MFIVFVAKSLFLVAPKRNAVNDNIRLWVIAFPGQIASLWTVSEWILQLIHGDRSGKPFPATISRSVVQYSGWTKQTYIFLVLKLAPFSSLPSEVLWIFNWGKTFTLKTPVVLQDYLGFWRFQASCGLGKFWCRSDSIDATSIVVVEAVSDLSPAFSLFPINLRNRFARYGTSPPRYWFAGPAAETSHREFAVHQPTDEPGRKRRWNDCPIL
jgi:hypothetical protein